VGVAALCLASDDANFLTGAVLEVDGDGASSWPPAADLDCLGPSLFRRESPR
jgi:hypothetical protein